MKIFMRDWVEKEYELPKPRATLTCGCQERYADDGILSQWYSEDDEGNPVVFYGVLCDKHFYEYGAEKCLG